MPRSRDDVHIVSTTWRKKVLASNFQPALWAITTYNSLLTPDWHEYPHFVPTQDVCGYSIP
ncbi:hypothetical protein H9625_08500 [Phocaeicola sp. Sa1CVN1]|uniref:Uncharacterized protein n=1 Tax=Phocaeicola intestinalis TaxID=2762212 RepID=A0ABR8Y8G3_9BACT|nr:hypothetical protein [Phocaeicola intestinalis]MBD8040474.1 hypothetical protein [Phocaeicola intestinalis]